MTVLRAPFTARTWAEALYSLIGLPLALAGYIYLAAAGVLSAALAITLLGVPLLATAVIGGRGWGALYRGLARHLLGLHVDAPPRLRRRPGIIGWIRTGYGDATGWRALAYLLVKIPLGMVTFQVTVFFWAYGLGALSYPLWWRFLPTERDSHGVAHGGFQLWGDVYVDTWPKALLLTVPGLVVVFAAPWAVRGVQYLDKLLIRALLGPSRTAARVRHLEETRAHAVDDSAAALRRIERDLHDGAQARLVAVAMKLGMAKETLDGEPDLARARELVDTAHVNAKEAIAELRDLARGIHPPVLDSGLDAALATLAARTAIPVAVDVDVPRRPSPAIETIVYFCAAELLTNVTKHSGARRATVTVRLHGDRLHLHVADDGTGGAAVDRTRTASGLAGLTDRIRTVDGTLAVESPAGGPTVVTVDLPCAS
jgi:signal transduction histidine kinase